MKTINLELSKRLAPYLENIETYFHYKKGNLEMCSASFETDIKTLTLEEVIEFLPKTIKDGDIYGLQINWQPNEEFGIRYNNYAIRKSIHLNQGKTLLEAIEKILEYLLDNKLLNKRIGKN